ncbi:hypothetical protein GQ473_03755 [archaeon]|nr:hypothetical protein [archaeon]
MKKIFFNLFLFIVLFSSSSIVYAVAPLITVVAPTNTSYDDTTITVNVSANDTIDTWWYSLNNGSNVTYTPNNTIVSILGSNNITFFANISGGEVGISDIIYFSVYNPITFSASEYTPTPPNEDQSVNLNITLSSSATTVTLEWNGSNNYTVTNFTGLEYSILIDSGNYTAHDNVTWKWYALNIYGIIFESSEQNLIVDNQISSVTAPYINDESPKNSDTIFCLGGIFSDYDAEDVEYSREFVWFMDDVQIAGETISTLDISTIAHEGEEQVYCKTRVSDSYDYSSWVQSSNNATLLFTAGFYEEHQASYVSDDLSTIAIDIIATAEAYTIPYVPLIVIFIVLIFMFRTIFISKV